MFKELRINEQIRAREVRVISESSEQLGIMPLPQAIKLARERDMDLVEVAPTSVPPVCRLLDYGRFKYQQIKKEKEAKKAQHSALLREIRMRPKIDTHDLDSKIRQTRKLLEEGDKVKVSVMFRGREASHPELGRGLMRRVLEALKEAALVERPLAMEGRAMTAILAPMPTKQRQPPLKEKEPVKETAKVKEVVKET